MEIRYCKNYEEMSALAAAILLDVLAEKRDLFLGASTGNSPGGLYAAMRAKYQADPELFNELKILKIDEWCDLGEDDPGTCERYLRQYLIDPLKLSTDRYIGFSASATDADEECRRVQQELDQHVPLDFCILGLGKNGHLALHEPAPTLQPDCHVALLAPTSREHDMLRQSETSPQKGMTLGLQTIFSSRTILLLISGTGKKAAIEFLLSKVISTQLPASLLWLHAHCICLIDQEAMD